MRPDFQDEWLTAYLDEELDDDQIGIVRERLEKDPAARQMLEDLKRVRQLVGTLPGWSGETLQKISTVATPTQASQLAAPTSDDVSDSVTVGRSPKISQGLLGRGWMTACALAASLLIVGGLVWVRYFDRESFPQIALETAQTAPKAMVPSETDSQFRAADVSLPTLAANDDKPLDSIVQSAPSVPLSDVAAPREAIEARGMDRLSGESVQRLNVVLPRARFGRSQAWPEAETSNAMPQVVQLIAPAFANSNSTAMPEFQQSLKNEQPTQARSEKAAEDASVAKKIDSAADGQLAKEQKQASVALVQVQNGAANVDGLFGEILTNYQLVPIVPPGEQSMPSSAPQEPLLAEAAAQAGDSGSLGMSLHKSEKKSKVGARPEASRNRQESALSGSKQNSESIAILPPPAKPGQSDPQFRQGLDVGGKNSNAERAQLNAGIKQSGQSPNSTQQSALQQALLAPANQAKLAEQSDKIILFLTRREAQQIIDGIPGVGKDGVQQKLGKAANSVNNVWWIIPQGIAHNQPENLDEKVILLLNASPR